MGRPLSHDSPATSLLSNHPRFPQTVRSPQDVHRNHRCVHINVPGTPFAVGVGRG